MNFDLSVIYKLLQNEKSKDSLQKIIDSAEELLGSEGIIFFGYESGTLVNFAEWIYSDSAEILNKFIENEKYEFIKSFLHIGESRFYDREDSLTNTSSNTGLRDFCEKQKIGSLAVVPVKWENRTIGVLFITYPEKHAFSLESKQLIDDFSKLTAIVYNNIISGRTIRKLRENLQDSIKEYETQVDILREHLNSSFLKFNVVLLPEMFSLVSHDMVNCLLRIRSTLHSINERIASEKFAREISFNIDSVKINIERVSTFTKLFRYDAFKISLEYIHEIARDIVTIFKDRQWSESKIKIAVIETDEEIPCIRCVKAEMAMILYNLINNAITAIYEQGKYESSKGQIQIILSYDKTSKFYLIVIEDNGIGIDNARLKDIFKIGYSTKYRGHGIGLYFVKNIVETQYGGSISCRSILGQGTVFELHLKQRNESADR